MLAHARAVARTPAAGRAPVKLGNAKLLETRHEAPRAWNIIGDFVMQQGQADLSAEVRRLTACMPLPVTEREWMTRELMIATADRPRQREVRRL